MIKPIFGRSKWGQNDVQLFITIYCPGIDVTKLDDMLTVDDEKFFFEAVDPVNNEKSTVIDLLHSSFFTYALVVFIGVHSYCGKRSQRENAVFYGSLDSGCCVHYSR